MGLSFSYFFPKNGDFSVPVTPFSLRGIGFDFTNFSGIESGFTLYRISGMNMKDLPFESDKALAGPFFSLMIPVDLVLKASFGNHTFKVKGGGFAFFNFGMNLNEGNFDRELRDHLGWEVLNTSLSVSSKPGIGIKLGAEYIIYFSDSFGMNFEANYLVGESELSLSGTYTGISDPDAPLETVEVNYPDAKLDFTGIELSLGVLFSP